MTNLSPCCSCGLLIGPLNVIVRSVMGAVAAANWVRVAVVPLTPVMVWLTGVDSSQNAAALGLFG